MRNLIVCCDGTGNMWSRSGETNIVKLVRLLDCEKRDHEVEQILYYDPGVGTAEGQITESQSYRARFARLAGLAWGNGAWKNVAEAYVWLMRHYQAGDHIFLFGFSRGAFTVRALAGLLYWFRLLKPEHENLLPTLIHIYRLQDDSARAHIAADMRERFSRPLLAGELDQVRECRDPDQAIAGPLDDEPGFPIHLIGVFDTVESVGFSGLVFGTINSDNRLKPGVRHARHALAIDEKRWPYEPRQYLSPNGPGQRLLQLWFAGAHCDVGGGYGRSHGKADADRESGLSDLTLWWMLEECAALGLRLKTSWQSQIHPDPFAVAHDESLANPLWAIAGKLRRVFQDESDQASPGPLLCHESVQLRLQRLHDSYKPPFVPAPVQIVASSEALRAHLAPNRAAPPIAHQPDDRISGGLQLMILLALGALALSLLTLPGAYALFKLQIGEWTGLAAALKTWQGPIGVGSLLWLDSFAVAAYFLGLTLLGTWLGHWGHAERRPSLVACYGFGALAAFDLAENLLTALTLGLANEQFFLGLPGAWFTGAFGVLVALAAWGKLVGAAASLIALIALSAYAIYYGFEFKRSSWHVAPE